MIRFPARVIGVFVFVAGLLLGGAAPSWAAGAVTRDWQRHPAVVEVAALPHDLYALGDVHSDYERLVPLLVTAKLIAKAPTHPQEAEWAGGAAVLVCTGDFIDKYNHALDVIALLRSLQPQAERAGGRVIVTLGNHEATFLASGGADKKSKDFADELKAAGLVPKDVAEGTDAAGIGAWLRELPVAAKVGDWFFCHAGNTGGRALADLKAELAGQISAGGFGAPILSDPNSMLEARLHPRPWWEADGNGPDLKDLEKSLAADQKKLEHEKGTAAAARTRADEAKLKGEEAAAKQRGGEARLRTALEALGAHHLVLGHQPGEVRFADGSVREAGLMHAHFKGLVFLIDTGMSRGVASGRAALLHVRYTDSHVSAAAVSADGKTAMLMP